MVLLRVTLVNKFEINNGKDQPALIYEGHLESPETRTIFPSSMHGKLHLPS